MTVNAIPRQRDVPVRVPVDAQALGFLWARCGVPRDTAIEWARDLDRRSALRVIAAYDEEAFDLMEAGGEGI